MLSSNDRNVDQSLSFLMDLNDLDNGNLHVLFCFLKGEVVDCMAWCIVEKFSLLNSLLFIQNKVLRMPTFSWMSCKEAFQWMNEWIGELVSVFWLLFSKPKLFILFVVCTFDQCFRRKVCNMLAIFSDPLEIYELFKAFWNFCPRLEEFYLR